MKRSIILILIVILIEPSSRLGIRLGEKNIKGGRDSCRAAPVERRQVSKNGAVALPFALTWALTSGARYSGYVPDNVHWPRIRRRPPATRQHWIVARSRQSS